MSHRIVEKLAKARAKLLGVVSGLSEEALDHHHIGWTVREILTHLLAAEEDHAKVITLIARGDTHRLPTHIERDEHNAMRLSQQGQLTLEQLLTKLAAQRQRTVALFERLNDNDQLDIIGRHPILGEMSVGKIFRIIALHEQEHIREIKAALKE